MDDTTRRILEMAAGGLSTPEAAELLGITVENARARLLDAIRELGAQSKLEAIVKALRSGLIRVDQDQ